MIQLLIARTILNIDQKGRINNCIIKKTNKKDDFVIKMLNRYF